MPVKDPQQNTHRWWGTLRIDPSTQVIDGTLGPDVDCTFLKTSQDAHFVAQGTMLQKVKVLSSSGDVSEAISRIEDVSQPILNRIQTDLSSGYPAGFPIVEILEIDNVNTPQLSKELSDLTKMRFQDDDWLDRYGATIGKAEIELGRAMAGLPKK